MLPLHAQLALRHVTSEVLLKGIGTVARYTVLTLINRYVDVG